LQWAKHAFAECFIPPYTSQIGYTHGRASFLEKLAELKRAGLIDDETGVEFTITHTFVDPPKRDE